MNHSVSFKIVSLFEKYKTVEDYAYIEVSKMSEKFAFFEESKKQVHFVKIEKLEGSKVKLDFTVESAKFNEALDQAFKENSGRND